MTGKRERPVVRPVGGPAWRGAFRCPERAWSGGVLCAASSAQRIISCGIGTAARHNTFTFPSPGAGRRLRFERARFEPARFQRKRRSRRLLVTTKTEEKAIAAPAIIGLSSPAAASGTAATL
jgi:hypothetical protein